VGSKQHLMSLVLAPKPPKVIHRKSNKTRIFRVFAANRLILGGTKLPGFRGSKATKNLAAGLDSGRPNRMAESTI
jgi:hypothetical protein